MRRRSTAALAAALPAALAVTLLSAPAAHAADTDVVINEVQSSSAVGAPDFIELRNTGVEAVDVSSWLVKDDDDTRSLRLPAGSIIAPGDFLVVEPDASPDGFGLGKADSARIYAADGTTLVDAYSWTEHAFTEGRLPDGAGAFVDTEPTPGAPNVAREPVETVPVASSVVINEVESNGDARGDWVELANTDSVSTVDLSGWSIVDGDPTHEPIVLPAGTAIESAGYLGIVTDGPGHNTDFGLGGTDAVTVRDASGAVVDTFAWEGHATTSYGRCADMTGELTTTGSATFELANDCGEVAGPAVPDEAWPFADEVVDAVAPGTWGEDMSGLDHASDGTLFAVNNDNAEIFELVQTGATDFEIAQSWIPTYPDGTGTPDAESITVAGDGAILLSTERDNEHKSISRPSILRVELGADGASATTHEWNLTDALGALGANAGVEGIEWISDADAVRLGVRDLSGVPGVVGEAGPASLATAAAAGTAYDPAAYGEHFGGIVAFAVEQTGLVYLAVLQADGGVRVLQAAEPGPAVEVVMGLDWRAGGNALWALCDDLCNSAASELAFVDGVLTTQRDVAAPATMPAGYTNEGIAIRWCDAGTEGVPTVAWISDSAHEGVSLRVAAGTCEAAVETPAPVEPGEDGGQDGGQDGGEDGGEGSGGEGSGSAAGDGASDGAGEETGGRSSLPRTGAEAPAGLLVAAALLLLTGLGLVLGRRRSA